MLFFSHARSPCNNLADKLPTLQRQELISGFALSCLIFLLPVCADEANSPLRVCASMVLEDAMLFRLACACLSPKDRQDADRSGAF